MGTIGEWSPLELGRYVKSLLQNDPQATPKRIILPPEVQDPSDPLYVAKTVDPWHRFSDQGYVAGTGVVDWDANLNSHQPAYRLTADKRCQLKGLIKAPAGGLPAFTVFFVLPYAPYGEMTFATVSNDAFASMGIQATVTGSGVYNRTALAANAWMSVACDFFVE